MTQIKINLGDIVTHQETMNTLPQATIERIEKQAKKYALLLVDEYEGTPQFICYQSGAFHEARLNLGNEQEIQRLKNDLLDALDLKNGNGATALSILKQRIKELELSLKQLLPMAKEYYERISKKSLGHQEFVRDDLDDITNAESLLSQP